MTSPQHLVIALGDGQMQPTESQVTTHLPQLFDARPQTILTLREIVDDVSLRDKQCDTDRAAESRLKAIADELERTCGAIEFEYIIQIEDKADDANAPHRHGLVHVSTTNTLATVRNLLPVFRRISEFQATTNAKRDINDKIATLQRTIDKFSLKIQEIDGQIAILPADDAALPTLREISQTASARRDEKIKAQEHAKLARLELICGGNQSSDSDAAVDGMAQEVARAILPRAGQYTAFSSWLAARRKRRTQLRRAAIGSGAVTAAVVCVWLAMLVVDGRNENALVPPTKPHNVVASREKQNDTKMYSVDKALISQCRMRDPQACAKVATSVELGDATATQNVRAYAHRMACEKGLQSSCDSFKAITEDPNFQDYVLYSLRTTRSGMSLQQLDEEMAALAAFQKAMCYLGAGEFCYEIGSTLRNPGTRQPISLARHFLELGCDAQDSQSCKMLVEMGR